MNLSSTEKEAILKQLQPKAHQQVFFSYVQYAEEVFSKSKQIPVDRLQNFTLVTGIANANPLVEFLKQKRLDFEHLNFKDHHDFLAQDVKLLKTKSSIVTTEKDYMRLQKYSALQDKLFYLPITVKIVDSATFDELIISFLKSY